MPNALTGYYPTDISGRNALAGTAPPKPSWYTGSDWENWYQSALPYVGDNLDTTALSNAGFRVAPGIQRSWGNLTQDERLQMLLNSRAADVTPGSQYGQNPDYGMMAEAALLAAGAGWAGGAFAGGAGAAGGGAAGSLPSISEGTGGTLAGLGGGGGSALNAGLASAVNAGTAGLTATGIGAGGVAASGGAAGGGFLSSLVGGSGGGGMGLGLSDWLNIGSTVLGAYSSKRAGDQISNASDAATAEQARQYDLARSDLAPYRAAGVSALGNLMDPNASFMSSPDYAFRRSEGQRDLGNSFAARGGAFSGNALRALDQYNSNLASGEFGNWWNRQAGLAGVGQAATNTSSILGQNNAANIGQNLLTGANARASGIQNSAGILAGGAANTIGNYLYRLRQPAYGGYGGASPYIGYGG